MQFGWLEEWTQPVAGDFSVSDNVFEPVTPTGRKSEGGEKRKGEKEVGREGVGT